MSDFVYLLQCADGSLYTGWTVDVDKRLAAHVAGKASRYTRSRLPVKLAGVIELADRSAAMREEARIKALSREDKLALLAELDATGRSRARSPGVAPAGSRSKATRRR